MERKLAYKFKLKVNSEQAALLEQFAGCSRFVWNKVLSLCLDRLRSREKILWYNEASFWLTLWKSSEEYGFLKDCHSQVLQQKLKDLDRAFKDAFNKNQPLKRIPRFKKKLESNSFRFPQGFKIDNRRIYLPKIGWVGFFKSQKIVGNMKNVTISCQAGEWFCSIQVEQTHIIPEIPRRGAVTGIDLGIKKFLALSDGTYVDPINSHRELTKKVTKAQNKLSKKKKFSKNYRKQKRKIQGLHSKIACSRLDFLHKISTQISKNHAVVVLEALKIRNMSKSAKGDAKNPGRSVKAKSGLNKAILDQGWGIFRTLISYKMKWSGGLYLEVPPHHTSQTCSRCGSKDALNRKSQAIFHCKDCGYISNADTNAAKNILTAGHAELACGERTLVFSVKQESVRTSDLVSPKAVRL